MLAILEKRLGIPFSKYDVYLNVVGGIHIDEPAADLAVCMALISSMRDIPVSDGLIAVGEVGLSGETRSVPDIEKRLGEAQRLGFGEFVMPRPRKSKAYSLSDMKLYYTAGIFELLKIFAEFGKQNESGHPKNV